jgi:FkbM family methyltransferase
MAMAKSLLLAKAPPFVPFFRRKAQTAAAIFHREGVRGVLRTFWLKLRQPLSFWRADWERVHIEGCDYVLLPDVNGFAMLVASTDVGIGRELALYRIHEPMATKLLRGFVPTGGVVLDIGANIGYYTLLLSRLVGNDGLVVAVEPHPVNFHLLQLNLRINRVSNVRLVSAAISDKDGRTFLFEAEGSNWHSLLPTERTSQKAIEVPTLTIDTLAHQVERPIDLLRMDIEGGELSALKGGEKTLRCYRPALVMEIHPPYLPPDAVPQLLSWLQSLGYERGFFVLRRDDFPWVKRPRRVWERTLSELLSNEALLKSGECFTLLLERP